MTDAMPRVQRHFAVDATLVAASRTAPVLVPLIFTPLVVGSFGVGLYAVWAILMTLIGILQNADLGFTAVMQRYHSRYLGGDDAEAGYRLTTTVLLAVVAVAVVVGLAGTLLAEPLVAMLDLPPDVRADAVRLLSPVGVFAGMQLIALALGGYLGGHARFLAAALSSLGARAGLAVILWLTLSFSWGVAGLIAASAVDAALAVVLAAGVSWRHLSRCFRGVMRGQELRELWSFGWRSQVSTLGFLAQRESDVLLATVLLPVAAVGSIAAAAQSSIAVALFPTILLMPLVTRIAYGSIAGLEDGVRIAIAANREWARLYPLYAGVMLGALGPAVAAWLGGALPDSPVLAVLIAAGMMCFLPGSVVIVTARSLGMPGIETSAYLALVLVKVALGVAGALLLGAVGLALSTFAASIAADIVVALRVRRAFPSLGLAFPSTSTVALAVVAAAVAGFGSAVAAWWVPAGIVRLLVIAVIAGAALVAAVALSRRFQSSQAA